MEDVKEATKRPWSWTSEDYSTAILHGPDYLEDHVLAVHPCKSCQERLGEEQKNKGWEWGRCTTPTQANAALIVRAVNSYDQMREALQAIMAPYKGVFSTDGHLGGCDLQTIERAFAALAAGPHTVEFTEGEGL